MHAIAVFALMGRLTDVKWIAKQMVECAPAEHDAADPPAGRRGALLGSYAGMLEFDLEFGNALQSKVASKDCSDSFSDPRRRSKPTSALGYRFVPYKSAR
ncbi:MAG: hypothetical protein WBP63_21145 [Silvibacterium sp.]